MEIEKYLIGFIFGIFVGFILGVLFVWRILPDRKDKYETNNP